MSDQPNEATHPGPLDSLERRVIGVLVEKAKTTPDAYPLSFNALRTGCNQKSNRFPQMTLDEDQVERTVESLRGKGALTVVQGDSRVERYRHRMYDWLGVEKAELAVVAELLCRGAQTVGDLRGRAARMEPIAGVNELKPILQSLVEKGLVEYLTPPGRGAIVTHTFYSESERERVCRDLGIGAGGVAATTAPAATDSPPVNEPPATSRSGESRAELLAMRDELTAQIAELREEIAQIRQRVEG